MQTAVMYGAGNIGRGFIGQVLHDSGYEVVFIDVNREVVDALNSNRRYPQVIVGDGKVRENIIDNVRAVDGNDVAAVAREIASCTVMATSVGANVLRFIAPNIAAGIKLRAEQGGSPLNILICENLMDAAHYLHGLLEPHLDAELLENTGLVEAVIGRMVPAPSPELQAGDPTRIAVEPFCELPVNREGFRGEIPHVEYMVPFSPFQFYEERKLYIHNMGHALTAYFGYLKGYELLCEAIADPAIASAAERAMLCVAGALSVHYGVDAAPLEEYVRDLLARFSNRALGDTVVRVGQDPMRKLKPTDRFIGAVNRCKSAGMQCPDLLKAVSAALLFRPEGDVSAAELQSRLSTEGAVGFLTGYAGLSEEDAAICKGYYEKLNNKEEIV